jgi:hypothetical protein
MKPRRLAYAILNSRRSLEGPYRHAGQRPDRHGLARDPGVAAEHAASALNAPDAMKERSLPLPGGCWKLPSIRLHQEKGGPNGNSV